MKFSRRIQNLIADFRGLPHDDSLSILKEEQSVENIMQNILKKYIKTSDIQTAEEIFKNWPSIVGNRVCGLCEPHKVSEKGELIIKTQDGIVRQELLSRKHEILNQIHRFCSKSRIDNIVFSL